LFLPARPPAQALDEMFGCATAVALAPPQFYPRRRSPLPGRERSRSVRGVYQKRHFGPPRLSEGSGKTQYFMVF